MSKELRQTYRALLKLREAVKDGRQLRSGICGNLVHLGGDESLIRGYFHRWPKFSGNRYYPVPSPTGGKAADYYDNCVGWRAWPHGLVRWEGAYGALRIELLDFLIEEIGKECA